MDRLTAEQLSRAMTYTPEELSWARSRPPTARTPIPSEGDVVYCRLDAWGPVFEARVERVQPADDVDDPHLYRADGGVADGRPILTHVDDPWPTLWLVVRVPLDGATENAWAKIRTHTREARLRGSPGWLPLDWADRPRWLPPELETLVAAAGEG